VVASAGEGQAEVQYHGETWQAISSEPLHPGQAVVIEAVEGLALRVTPRQTSLE
jgi:membrane protein implicated in regulation of membrane protease activity